MTSTGYIWKQPEFEQQQHDKRMKDTTGLLTNSKDSVIPYELLY